MSKFSKQLSVMFFKKMWIMIRGHDICRFKFEVVTDSASYWQMSLMLFSKITYQSRSLKWQCGKELESREASMGSDWPQIGDVADIMHLGFGKEALRRSFMIFLKMEKYGLNDSLLKTNFYVAKEAHETWLCQCEKHISRSMLSNSVLSTVLCNISSTFNENLLEQRLAVFFCREPDDK